MSDVTTTNAGQADVDRQSDNSRGNALVGVLIACIIVPFTAISGFLAWIAFSKWRYRRSVIATFLVGFVVFVTSWLGPLSISWLVDSLPKEGVSTDWGKIILLWITVQFAIGTPVGVALGLIYASIRWFQRSEWEEYDFRITPWELRRGRKTANKIRLDEETPLNGFTLGINNHGDRVIQTDKDAATHTLVVGASGSGKTTTIMSKARDAIKRGQGLVFVDLKGGPDVPDVLSKFAKRYGRKFSHWTLQPRNVPYSGPDMQGPAYYDPLARGEATRRKDLLIASRDWSEEFYKIEASNYLQLLFYIIIANPNPEVSTLSDVVSLLNPRALMARAKPLIDNPIYADIIAGIESLNDERISPQKRNAIEGLRSQLAVILNSVAGQWLNVDPKGHNINLKEAAHNGDIVVFSLDSSNYQELASLVANLIIQDLKTVTSELRDDPSSQPMQIFIDEFSAIGSENIIGLINKSRDAGLPVTLATQALGDLRRVNEAFLDQLIGIVSSYIIHRANKEDDAQVYAGLTGKVKRKRFSQNVDYVKSRWSGMGKGAGTGGGRVEEVEEYLITPNEIQQLGMGEMVYIAKAQQPVYIEHVTVIPEDMVEEDIEDSNPDLTFDVYKPQPVSVDNNIEDVKLEVPWEETITVEEVELETPAPDVSVNLPKKESRLSDPNKISQILNNIDDVTVSPSLPIRPIVPNRPEQPNEKDNSEPDSSGKAKDEFEF